MEIVQDIQAELEQLYNEMQRAYNRVARMLSLQCGDCDDNCCDSLFRHHTYLEWYYLWQGIGTLSEEKRNTVIAAAYAYMQMMEGKDMQKNGKDFGLPMCPLNQDGQCILYRYRLVVCRTYGVPATFVRPDGKRISFPGCHRCRQITERLEDFPQVDRTLMYTRMADLERRFRYFLVGNKTHVNLTIAEMIVFGPPKIKAL